MTRDLDALARAGLRDGILAELRRRGLDDLERLSIMTDAELRRIPNIGTKALAVIRACIAAA